ncbi:MAG: sulfotransferase [Chloroflexota bacterium]|nr:sulfotransferase [Chloroflexota bacterium]
MSRVPATTAAPAGGPLRYVLIASNAYSGSTLLSFLLGQHPDIATISDVSGTRRKGQMETFACSCGLLMQTCTFWQGIREAMRLRGYDDFRLEDFELGFDGGRPQWLSQLRARSLRWTALEELRDRVFLALGSGPHLADIGARNLAFAEAVLSETGRQIFVDASKERTRVRFLSRYLHADLRVIHLVRDVRGVVDSTLRHGNQPLTAIQAARRWERTNATIMRNLSAVPANRQVTIRYEDLCRDLDGSLATLFGLCGVEPMTWMGDDFRTNQHLLGNPMRLGGRGDVSLDERWRSRLSVAEQCRIIRAAGWVFRRLYADERQPTGIVRHA